MKWPQRKKRQQAPTLKHGHIVANVVADAQLCSFHRSSVDGGFKPFNTKCFDVPWQSTLSPKEFQKKYLLCLMEKFHYLKYLNWCGKNDCNYNTNFSSNFSSLVWKHFAPVLQQERNISTPEIKVFVHALAGRAKPSVF